MSCVYFSAAAVHTSWSPLSKSRAVSVNCRAPSAPSSACLNLQKIVQVYDQINPRNLVLTSTPGVVLSCVGRLWFVDQGDSETWSTDHVLPKHSVTQCQFLYSRKNILFPGSREHIPRCLFSCSIEQISPIVYEKYKVRSWCQFSCGLIILVVEAAGNVEKVAVPGN